MQFILKHRVLIIIFAIITTILVGTGILFTSIDVGLTSLFPEDNPDYVYYKEMEELFGANDQIVIGITDKTGIYKSKNIKLVQEISDFLSSLKEINEDNIISLSKVDNIISYYDELVIKKLPLDDLGVLKREIEDNNFFKGKLVSNNKKSTVIIANVGLEVSLVGKDSIVLNKKINKSLEVLRKKYPDVEINLSGMPITKAVISKYMVSEILKLSPLGLIVVIIIFYLLFRSLYGVLAPIIVTGFSIIWIFGIKGFLGSPITIAETSVPVLIIAIGCADGVHIIHEFMHIAGKKGMTIRNAILKTMKILKVPVIMTSITTALGLLSLLTAPGAAIRNIGIFASIGVMVAMCLSLFFIPALIAFSSKKSIRKIPNLKIPFFDNAVRYKYLIIIIALVIFMISIYGIINVKVEADELKYFKKNNPLRIATEKIQDDLGGIVSLDIILNAKEPDTFKQPWALKEVEKLQKFCDKQELVSYSLSLVDYVKRLNYVLDDSRTIPKTSNGIAQYLLLYEFQSGSGLENFVDDAYQQVRINVRLRDTSNQMLADLIDKINYELRITDYEFEVKYANYYIWLALSELIIKSQIKSLLVVVFSILLLLIFLFRSFKAGFITTFPIFIAIMFNFAIMLFFGITLNVGTSIIASVVMGIGIDYAIHYFSRYRLILKETKDINTALKLAITKSSGAILANATAVGFGMLVLTFSEYHIIASVGWITALSMFTTAVCSLTLLPALASILKAK